MLAVCATVGSLGVRHLAKVVHAFAADVATRLTQTAADRHLHRTGRNAMKVPAPRPALDIFAAQFVILPVGVLAGAALSLCTGAVFVAVAISAVLGVNELLAC
jgi:hypothetical protein